MNINEIKEFLKHKYPNYKGFIEHTLVAEMAKTYAEHYQALQLQQTGVMLSACKHDEENDTKAYAKNGNEFIGYYCEKCDTVYCGSI